MKYGVLNMRRTKTTLWTGSTGKGKKTLSNSIDNYNCIIAEGESTNGSMYTYLYPLSQTSGNYMTMGYKWESNTKMFREPSRLQFTDRSTCYNNNGTMNELQTGNNTDTMWYEPNSNHAHITEINGYNDDEELLYDGTATTSVTSSEISLNKAADNYSILKFILGDANNDSLVSYYLKVDKSNSTMKFMLNGCYSTSSAFTIYNSLWHFNGFTKVTCDNKALYYSKNWGTSYYVNYNISYTYTTSTTDFKVRPIRKIYGIK